MDETETERDVDTERVHPYTDEGITKLDVLERYAEEVAYGEGASTALLLILSKIQELQRAP